MAQIVGRATIYVDGKQMEMERGAKLNPGGFKRDPEMHGGKVYHREEEVVPTVEGNVLHTADSDVIEHSAIAGATVIFQTDVGHKYVLRGCSTQEPVDMDTGSGKGAIKLFGESCDKM